jgi:hypothetical protein
MLILSTMRDDSKNAAIFKSTKGTPPNKICQHFDNYLISPMRYEYLLLKLPRLYYFVIVTRTMVIASYFIYIFNYSKNL